MNWGSDPAFFILIGLFLLALLASSRVKSTFQKYGKVRNMRNLTGAQAAEMLLRQNGIYDVRIEAIPGELSDHYDPRTKTVRLSESVYGVPSVSAVSVACHEVGHAIQHNLDYAPLKLRTLILPVAQLGSQALWPLFFMGIIFSLPPLVYLGIAFFSFSVIFQILTLPVEFDASARALKQMEAVGILSDDENESAKKVLRAAAMTYVAAAAMAVGQLVRMILLSRRR